MEVLLNIYNTNIRDSYMITKRSEMKKFIEDLREEYSDETLAIHKRSIYSMVNEWRTHNLLYRLGIETERTKDVDLDVNQPFYNYMFYFLLGF